MNDETRESISALADDELNDVARTRLVDRMTEDRELRETWERYHLIRDCLTDAVPLQGADSLAARIQSKLEHEPVVLAHSKRRRRAGFLKPIAGAAIAASVAVLAVLGVQSLSTSTDASRAVTNHEVAGLRWDTQEPAVEQRLNSYLVNHSEYQGNGMHGMLPYARIVGYDSNK